MCASVTGLPPEAVTLFARTLSLRGKPLDELAEAYEHGCTTTGAAYRMSSALESVARHPACAELIEELESAEEPALAALRRGLVGMREELA